MTKTFTTATMSLDGFIADPHDGGFDHLFRWYANGDVEVPTTNDLEFRTSAASAAHIAEMRARTGVMVVGRRLFDLTNGWDGNHPYGLPIVVVTHQAPSDWAHPDADFTFVTDGIEPALEQARAIAGDKWIAVTAGTLARQCLDAGLLDEVWIDLAPVVLGAGIPFFGPLDRVPIDLGDPTIVAGTGVTHLRYQVVRL